MCDQFYERIGKNVVNMLRCDCVEIRSVYDKAKLAWILMNFKNLQQANDLWKKMPPPLDRDILNFNLKIKQKGKNAIETVETVNISWEYKNKNNLCVYQTNDGKDFYCLCGFLYVVIPENIIELMDLMDLYQTNNLRIRTTEGYHGKCIRNDDLKKFLTPEQMELCELNRVFGPVVKIQKDWIV